MTTTYENYVKLRFKQAYPDAEPIAAKVATAAVITAYFPIPQSASKKRKAEMAAGEILPTVKADSDNIAKIILDSLNGLAFYDDAQVIELIVHKRYAEVPKVDVQIMEYAEYLQMCAGGKV